MSGKKLVEVTWDPVTRVIGSLGIHTRIDFDKVEINLGIRILLGSSFYDD